MPDARPAMMQSLPSSHLAAHMVGLARSIPGIMVDEKADEIRHPDLPRFRGHWTEISHIKPD